MAAKRKKQALTIYSDDFMTLKGVMTVEVDDSGEGWLTPDQVKMLEAAYRSASLYRNASDSIQVVRNLVMHSRVPRKPVAISTQASSQLVTLLSLGVQSARV